MVLLPPHRPKKLFPRLVLGVDGTVELEVVLGARDGVEGFLDEYPLGSGVDEGVVYASRPCGKTVLYSLTTSATILRDT